MSFCITMVGMVCSGKTTIVNSLPALTGANILSSDKYLYDLVATERYKDYPAAYKFKGRWAVGQFEKDYVESVSHRCDVVIDRLNTSPSSRKKILSENSGKGYENICIYVVSKTSECLARYEKLNNKYLSSDRYHNFYRDIPKSIFYSIAKDAVEPSLDEGFDTIIRVSSTGRFLSVIGAESDMATYIMMQLD